MRACNGGYKGEGGGGLWKPSGFAPPLFTAMGRQPCCDKVGLKKGPWTAEEDKKLVNFILTNGQCCWRAVPKLAGLLRCGKSCRLRWTNYLRPDLKRGLLSESEEKMVIELHSQLGNRWSKIASHLPGRTDNEIKNHWNTHIKKKLRRMGIDPLTHRPLLPSADEAERQHKVADEQVNATSTVHHAETDAFLSRFPGFCVDEVPMIQQHEILVPAAASTSSSCCSSSSSVKAEDIIQIPCLEWPEPAYLYGLDEYLGGWDFISEQWDENLGSDPVSQCQKEQPWTRNHASLSFF